MLAAKKIQPLHGDDVATKTDKPVSKIASAFNLARSGIAVALLAVLMALGVYVALDAKLTTLAHSVADLPARVSALDAKVATFENLPATMRHQMVADRLADMAATAQRLAAGLDTEDQKVLMSKISDLAKQLQTDVAK